MTSITTTSGQTLRLHAEEKFRANDGPPTTNLSLEETRLFCELQVHQIELEMQNEELHSAKNELEALYARYFDLYDLAPLSYFTISDEGVILEANLTAATLLGVNRGGLVNQPLNRFIHKEDRKIFDLYSKLNVESGEPQTYELRMMKMDGTPMWAHLTATTGQNPTMESGQDSACATFFRIVLLDITLQKKAEKEYREIEERHRLIVHTTMDGYWLMDLQGRLLEVNDKYCLISGYSKQELLSMRTPDLEVAESAAEIASRIQTIMAIGKHKYEARYRNKDGSIIDVEVSAQYLPMDGGRIVAFLSDATKRKRIEERLKTSEREFRQLAESMPQIVWICSPDGSNAYFNQQWVDYTGLTLEESYGDGWIKPFHPDDRQKAWDSWQNAVQNGAEYEPECRLRRSDGVYTWWLIRGVPAKDEHGVILKWFGTCTDIDDIKRNAAHLQEKNSEMERFTYTVSHDLKSPLITISTYSGMIKKELEAGEFDLAKQDLKWIEEASAKMADLLDDLLELSRIGRVINAPERIDMNRLVKDTLMLLADPHKQKNIEIIISQDLPVIRGDQKRIAVVVQNLLENAIKYRGDQPALKIEIGARREPNENVFFVKDNGKGIDPTYHDIIFGLFNKLDHKSIGTGVGLAIVKRTIEGHGGRVWVDSEGSSKGSCFYFTLPIAAVQN